MAVQIVFGDGLRVRVEHEHDAADLATKLAAHVGNKYLRLLRVEDRSPVFVNPATVAYVEDA